MMKRIHIQLISIIAANMVILFTNYVGIEPIFSFIAAIIVGMYMIMFLSIKE